jgi:hypothetical protein
MLTIKRGKDKRIVHALLINLADLPDGVTLSSKDLVKGTPVMEGSVIGRDANGVGHLIKTAAVYAAAEASATSYQIAKGSHFKKGDFVTLKIGGTASAITAVDRDSSSLYDVITVEATLGSAQPGNVLKEAKAAGSKSEFKNKPEALLAESYDVEGDTNIFVAAVTIGQFKSALVPAIDAEIKAALTANGSFINFV